MPKVKVLPLEFWMECEPFNDDPAYAGWGEPCSDHMKKTYPETTPVFNRDGMYKHGDRAWFEINGKAFSMPVKSFQFQLDVASGGELSDEKYKALGAIIRVGLSTRKQYYMHYHAMCYRQFRDTERSSRKWVLELRRK